MTVLMLPVKGEYFDEMKSGGKIFEYRLRTPYWSKRLVNREYNEIIVTKGYPKRTDTERRLHCLWSGYEEHTITHEHFGPDPVEVFAIYINPIPRHVKKTPKI